MRTFTTVALGLLGAAVASASDVSSLTKDTFTDFVTENDLVLAECECPYHSSAGFASALLC
jgi:protein disulfide-isomerase A1